MTAGHPSDRPVLGCVSQAHNIGIQLLPLSVKPEQSENGVPFGNWLQLASDFVKYGESVALVRVGLVTLETVTIGATHRVTDGQT